MDVQTKPFDPAEYLETDEDRALYLAEAIETGDVAFIRDSLNVIARATGMSSIAQKANISRESLYRSLGPERNLEFETVIRVMMAFGLKIKVSPAETALEKAPARKAKAPARSVKRPSRKAAVARSAKRARRAGSKQ